MDQDMLVQKLVSHLRAGEAPGRRLLGVEVEHFCVNEDGLPLTYELAHELLVGQGLDEVLSFEPAAQLEMSLAPHARIHDIAHAYQTSREVADRLLAERGFHIVTYGCHPTCRVRDLALSPSTRYQHINDYLARLGAANGALSMRSTASVHVSLDFVSEADAVRKLRIGSALAPILAAICDNSPVFERRPNHTPLRRLALWRNVDASRCGTVPDLYAKEFGYKHYAAWVLAAPPMFERGVMEAHNVEDLLHDVWPYARLKRVVELRAADCMPAHLMLGYVALIKGLFYSEASLAAIEKCLGVVDGIWPIGPADIETAFVRIREHRHSGLAFGKPLVEWEQLLFSLAREALDAEEAAYLAPLEDFAAHKPWWYAHD